MIYSRSKYGRREGDCVMHVPPTYNGSLFLPVHNDATIEPDIVSNKNDIIPEETENTIINISTKKSEMSDKSDVFEKFSNLLKDITSDDLLIIGLIIILSQERNCNDVILLLILLLIVGK